MNILSSILVIAALITSNRFDSIYNDDYVVTGVDLYGLATEKSVVDVAQAATNYTDKAIENIPQGTDTNAVQGIINNNVATNYLCTLEKAQMMADTAAENSEVYTDKLENSLYPWTRTNYKERKLEIGYNALANNLDSVALGYNAIASSDSSTAIGANAITTNNFSVAIGAGATTSGLTGDGFEDGSFSIAIGAKTKALYSNSISIGNESTIANGINSVSIGNETFAAENSISLGNRTEASGNSSISFGYDAISSGDSAISYGASSTATGPNALAIGSFNSSSALASISIGNINTSSNQWAVAIGNGAETTSDNSIDIRARNNLNKSLETRITLDDATEELRIKTSQSEFISTVNKLINKDDLNTYATKSELQTIDTKLATTKEQVDAVGAHLNAEDAHFVSTNYDSVVHIPEAYVEVKIKDEELTDGTNTYSWITIWREMTRWNAFTGEDFDWTTWRTNGGFNSFSTNITAQIDSLNLYKAERAWGLYNSATGLYSPEGTLQLSASNILISADMAFQQVESSGMWVLTMNSGTWSMGSDTNGYFRVKDADGNVQFEIVKGDKVEVGADADGLELNNSSSPPIMTIHYSVESDEHPTLQFCDDLKTLDWKAEGDSDVLATVTWSGTSGDWTATVQRYAVGNNRLFVRASYMRGGETYINNRAPVAMESIILGGVKYYLGTATIDGNTVLTLSTTKPQ